MNLFVAAASVVFAYSPLTGPKCEKPRVVHPETGATEQRCPGSASHTLKVLYDDGRMSISVVGPDAKEFPLDYWTVVTSGFSHLGDKAEWALVKDRSKKEEPVGLIVRVVESRSDRKATSVLAVAKITPQETCVTATVPAGKNANEKARAAAREAATKPCLGEAPKTKRP